MAAWYCPGVEPWGTYLAETIANWFVTTFEGTLAREWIVFLVSLLPILELRGGIIAGFAMNMERAFWEKKFYGYSQIAM